MKLPVRLLPALFPAVLCLALASPCLGGVAASAGPLREADTPASSAKRNTPPAIPGETVVIPGPLRSFLRMAGISQKISSDEVLPLLARNVYLQGYRGTQQVEFLILLNRYVHQARELQILAGPSSTIRVSKCDDAGTLVQILGYRLREACGQKDFHLETANPERAFLTIDSGFPLVELEEALQNGTPFTYPYAAARVPLLFHEADWMAASAANRKSFTNVLDALMNDQTISRLYFALSKQDGETRSILQRSVGLPRLLPLAPSLDFYGSQICIRSGHVFVPGGVEQGWKDLVGEPPSNPAEFVPALLAKDDGWLAAYFDVLSRVSRQQQEHLTESPRLKRLYEAFRSSDSKPPAAKGVFRKAPELLVLFTTLQWEPDGKPHIPGNLAVWGDILHGDGQPKLVHDWAKKSKNWTSSDQLLEAMVAFSRLHTDVGPLQIYLTLSSLDAVRPADCRLSPGTVRLLASKFAEFGNWYLVFSEFPQLDDASMARFIEVADTIDGIKNPALRTNALGSFQASVGIWQILARQGQIAPAELNPSWQGMASPFATVTGPTQLFDASRASFSRVLLATGGAKPPRTQDEMVDLLAGPPQTTADGQRVHKQIAEKIRTVLEDQRLVSIETLFALSDGLAALGTGGTSPDKLLPLAGELREFEMPRPIFTQSEKVSWAPKVFSNHHAELQIRTDLTKVIKTPGTPAQLEAARGQLAPFLRDTLVGLNYAYYEPPGAQILHHNPLFVRSHDFSGVSITGSERLWQTPILLGAGSPAGGGAYLMGSLSDLAYALALTEQDFIAPENVQALIWKELVPDLLVNATVARWWDVSPNELHAATLAQKAGEELVAASASNEQLRFKVIAILADRMTTHRLEETELSLQSKDGLSTLLPRLMPAETFYLASEFQKRYPAETAAFGPAGQQLASLKQKYPAEVSWERLSRDFGVSHPTLARNSSREILTVKPFPFFGGYSSHLFGESWDSSNLYWARLVDEAGYPAVMLNSLVPELTRTMTAKIFATDLEDWPAMLRAMQETGDEFKRGKKAAGAAVASAGSLPVPETTR